MSTQQRNAIIERIRKLQRMTTQAGCTEAEAALAAQRVAELMTAHNVTIDETTLRTDAQGMLQDFLVCVRDNDDAWLNIAVPIRKLFGTRCWYSTHSEDALGLGIYTNTIHLNFFGYPVDVAASIALAQICIAAINTESAIFAESLRGRKNTRRSDTRDFRIGMADRLAQRIRELIPANGGAGTGTALIVLKNQLVTAEFAKLHLHLGKGKAQRAVNAEAYALGSAKGANIDLNQARKVRGQLAIGCR